MASVLGLAVAGLAVGLVVGVHTVIAAVAARFFRLRLSTRWGAILYTVVLVPILYVATASVLLGALRIGTGFTIDEGYLLALFWGVPLSLGISIDWFWVPPPEELDLPDRPQEQ